MAAPKQNVRGDFHVHTAHTDCRQPAGSLFSVSGSCERQALAELASLADRSGLEYFALINHASDPARPHQADAQTNAKILHQATVVMRLNARRKKTSALIFSGVETNLLSDGSLDVDRSVLMHVDVVLLSRQGGPRQLTARIRHGLIRALRESRIDILGQPGRQVKLAEADWESLIRVAVQTQTAIEFTLRQGFSLPLARVVAQAGALVALGSDAHHEKQSPHTLVRPSNGAANRLLKEVLAAKIKPSRILNLQPLSVVRRWLQHRPRG